MMESRIELAPANASWPWSILWPHNPGLRTPSLVDASSGFNLVQVMKPSPVKVAVKVAVPCVL